MAAFGDGATTPSRRSPDRGEPGLSPWRSPDTGTRAVPWQGSDASVSTAGTGVTREGCGAAMASPWEGDSPSGRGTGFPFVGRREELHLLAQALEQGPAVILVEGEAGVGKSRLVQEATEQAAADGLTVLRGCCHPLREPLPFGPVIDALHDAHPQFGHDVELSPSVAALAPYIPELATHLAQDAPHAPSEADGPGQPLMGDVQEVLRALSDVILVVEDVQWADTATCELLLMLARNPPPGLRLVLTYREGELAGRGSVLGAPYRRPVGVGGIELSLAPLGPGQVRELAAAALGESAAAALGRQLFERSGGLPLAAEEDLLVLAGRLQSADGHNPVKVGEALEGLGVPRALQEAVNGRVAQLPPAAAAVVQAAAVLAVPAPEELLAALAALEEEQTEDALVDALEANVLIETTPGRYGFRHALARQAVYEEIQGPRRRRLHRRAIEKLAGQELPALVQIAHHTRMLGDTAAWLPRALAAADHAEAVGDDGVTADLLQQILAEPTLPADQRIRTALALSRIAMRRVSIDTSVAALRHILADPDLPTATRGEIRLNLGRILLNHGMPGASAEIEQSVDELTDVPALAAIAMATAGMGNRSDTSTTQDTQWMDRAVHTAAESGDAVAQATVEASRITLLAARGEPLAQQLLDRLPRHDPDPDILRQSARALSNAAESAFWRGRDDDARTLLEEAEELARHTKFQWLQVRCDVIRLELDFAHGHWTGLEERIEAHAPQAAEDSSLQVEPQTLLALLDVAHGQWTRARERIGNPMTYLNMEECSLACTAALARINLAEGEPQAAWTTLQPALETIRNQHTWVWTTDTLPTAVQAALACQLRTDAEHLIEEAEQGIEGLDAPAARAEILWGRGLLAADTRPTDAIEHLEQARTVFRGLGRAHRAARITEQVGRLLLATDPARATRRLQEALDVFTRLGATADAAQCRRTLRGAGQEPPTPRRRADYGADLSPRERQVAELLSAGASNQDIAHALALSPRTVEHHVANVLRKLAVTRDHVRDALP
ncbi:ATP-binding protein [Kitasatospora sp. NPDC088346]|uniref:ATP-binding protein n=1 Tax=Kitasatospora sp. NPDC088346 TaxID=3364073 RepID=UPI003820E345